MKDDAISRPDRRDILKCLAGGLLTAACGAPAAAAAPRLARLIAESQDLPDISARIERISRGLIGSHYRGYTLIGGPRQPEVMVVRDDGFDCVTYCETVLAAATVRYVGDFEPMLRRIRYHDGVVNWFERNHYHYDWSARNIENGICRALDIPGAVAIEKTVFWHRELGRRRMAMMAVPAASLAAHRDMLRTGDIIGFVTRRLNLDFFHTGFIVIAPGGDILLRHASQSRRRVLDEPMDGFMRAYRVRFVTLLRPLNPLA